MVEPFLNSLSTKKKILEQILLEMQDVVVAVSGGVDSIFLAKIAHDTLGDNAISVTADSPSLPRRELKEIIRITQQLGIPHKIVQTVELDDPNYYTNPVDRCYFCKDELFDQLDFIKQETGARWVLFGENVDDQSDHRPGSQAAFEHGVRAPLKEAGMTKSDIRTLAKEAGVAVWDKPASACLASRIPYGETVTKEKLSQVEAAEDFLFDLGFDSVRVRHHGEIARIEVPAETITSVVEHSEMINQAIKSFGFKYTTIDLGGYRRGSFNDGMVHLSEIGNSGPVGGESN